MCSSYSKWWFKLAIGLVLVSCKRPAGDWIEVSGVSNAGYSIEMPVEPATQIGSVVVQGDTLITYIHICIDSSITYVAAHFDLPDDVLGMAIEERTTYLWEGLNKNVEATFSNSEGPRGADKPNSRSLWGSFPDETEMGVALQVNDRIGVIMNAGIPSEKMDDKARARIERFVRSLKM